jgi:hypothetical protein
MLMTQKGPPSKRKIADEVNSVFTLGLTNGGSAGLIYSYLFSFIGSIAVFTTMGEMASM